MKRRNIIMLSSFAILLAGGIFGYDAWQDHKQEQIRLNSNESLNCTTCSFLKKDLADKVKQREQQSQ